MRRMLVSRSSREKPRPFERFWPPRRRRTSDRDAGDHAALRSRRRRAWTCRARQTSEPEREAASLRDPPVRCQLGLSHLFPVLPFRPPSPRCGGGTGGGRKRNGPASVGSGPICVARARLQANRASSDAGNHSATNASAPRGAAHIIRQGGTTAGVVWCAINEVCYLLAGTRGVNHTFGCVDKDWAGGLVTAHAAYPFASPAPSSPPVAWGEPRRTPSNE